MADTFEQRFSAESLSTLNRQTWNRFIRALNVRMNDLEKVLPPLKEVEELLLSIGLTKINEILVPAFNILTNLLDLGVLFTASSASPHSVTTGIKEFIIPEEEKGQFAPGIFLSIISSSESSVGMFGQKQSYDRETGSLFIDVTVADDGGISPVPVLSDWNITIGTPPNIIAGDAASIGYNGDVDADNVGDALDALHELLDELPGGIDLSTITGTLAIAKGGTGQTSAAAAFNALKQSATDSVTGVLRKATQSEALAGNSDTGAMTPLRVKNALDNQDLGTAAFVNLIGSGQFRAATANRALSSAGVWSDANWVQLADAGTIAVNMASFLGLAFVTLGGNRTLGNPTNTKPGQSFVIQVSASGSTRTLTLGSNYKLWSGIETGPYSVNTNGQLFVCGFVRDASTVEVTAIGRR